MELEIPEINGKLKGRIFEIIREQADATGEDAYIVGGFVRDIFLNRKSKDIDVVTGSGIKLAEKVRKALGREAKLTVFKTFGTAHIDYRDTEIEFVGARKESYSKDSRKPVVETGTIEDDLARRDFTINAMAVKVNSNGFGTLIDMFGGLADLDRILLKTPLDPDVTFTDDPLRMMRAVRFASQLGFFIAAETFEAIERNRQRIEIVSAERITEELNKIMLSPRPSVGFELMEQTGLLTIILPELTALKGIETRDGVGHKDNFAHTLKVVDNLSAETGNLYLRWAALFHDIGKPKSKRFDPKLGWTFHSHEYTGMKMLKNIFTRLKLPLGERLKYAENLVLLHMRPVALSDEEVTDSAVRRLLFEAGDSIDDLMLLCEADITSKNPEKIRKFLNNFRTVRIKLKEIEEKDRLRNFQPPIDGLQIMEIFGLPPGPQVGELKIAIKDAILDGVIPNEYDAAYNYLMQLAAEKNIIKTESRTKNPSI
ncbi:MAG: CCA tRNA nucleotidyltransferase [Dysgonamonadaceae bacterium]|jgi:poly(A) polymerase|nr:CCA tRNA nucleotidyltransferase [Dysgonamonadaceae bacterium]